MANVLIIAGMHRSGTSLVSQWLYRCGLSIGDKLFPADVGNIEGHFEDTDFLDMHRQFLKKRNCIDTGFIHTPFAPLTPHEKKQVKDLIDFKNNEHEIWGWKEPRTCLFLDTYDELIPNAKYLFVVRDFRSTLNSMLSREYKVHIKKFNTKRGLSRLKWILFKKKPVGKIYARHAEDFIRVWIFYYEKILKFVRQLPLERYEFVNYTSLADNDMDVFMRLRDEWHFPLRYVPFNTVYKKELLSELKNVEEYIKDRSLIEKAKRIEKEFQHYLATNGVRC